MSVLYDWTNSWLRQDTCNACGQDIPHSKLEWYTPEGQKERKLICHACIIRRFREEN